MSIIAAMPSENTTELLGRSEKNSIKNKLAIAFIHALNAPINYVLNESGRELDGLGIDYTFVSALVGQNRTIASSANTINVQLKSVSESSASMFSEHSDRITYKLSRELLQIGLSPTYLFVVVLPPEDEIESWREVNEKDILLKARGYYLRVNGRLGGGHLDIPKNQRLTPSNYKLLFADTESEATE